MNQATRSLHFYYEHLGRYLAPETDVPADTIAPSLPTRTKNARAARAKDPSAPLDVRRIGTGMPVYYIITEDKSLFLSNTEPPEHPSVTAIRIDDEDGKAAILGNQYIAHWLYHEAPIDQPFMIGSIEKANPLPSLCISTPPLRATYCTTSGKTGSLTIHLQDFRDDIDTVKASGTPWKDIKAGLKIKRSLAEQVNKEGTRQGYEQARQENPLRKEMQKLQKKYPDLLKTLSALNVMSGSPNEKVMDWFFVNDNVYGKK